MRGNQHILTGQAVHSNFLTLYNEITHYAHARQAKSQSSASGIRLEFEACTANL